MTDSLKLKIDELYKEYELIKEHLKEERMKGDLSNNPQYDYWRKRMNEVDPVVDSYDNLMSPICSFKRFIRSYFEFKKWCDSNSEEFPILNDRMKRIQEHYHPELLKELDYNYHPTSFYELKKNPIKDNKNLLKKDLNTVLKYFNKDKRDFVYVWELEYVSFLLFYDQLCETHYVDDMFGKDKNCSEECISRNHQLNSVIYELKEHHNLPLEVLIRTVYDIYHYYHKMLETDVVKSNEFVLLDKLISLVFLLSNINYDEYHIGVYKKDETYTFDEEEQDFLFSMSQLLCLDLIHTIKNIYPEYYSSKIIFMGYNLYEPAGCSSLSLDMSSYESYINGLHDYDFWFEIDGEKVFQKIRFDR